MERTGVNATASWKELLDGRIRFEDSYQEYCVAKSKLEPDLPMTKKEQSDLVCSQIIASIKVLLSDEKRFSAEDRALFFGKSDKTPKPPAPVVLAVLFGIHHSSITLRALSKKEMTPVTL